MTAAASARESHALLAQAQNVLLDLGCELSIPGHTLLEAQHVEALDTWLHAANATLPRLQEFVAPGGPVPTAQAHMRRTICRRTERAVVQLAALQAVSHTVRQYLNRLSDLMPVLARGLNPSRIERQWNQERPS